ncbi:MAG: hypothetical protein SGI90_12445 [Candidatus Eisenbacteria bacterium]|nr:hypothetical protein [Candidatus Eisenbacteria bacterium]
MTVYSSEEISAGGGYAPNYLPGLEKYWGMVAAKFCLVVCTNCGLARFFVSDEAVSRIPESEHWRKV